MKLNFFATNLYAHEFLHFLSALIISLVVYKLFKEFSLVLIALFVSFLIDLDHYTEGFLFNRFKIGWIFKELPAVYWERTGKVTLFFHSWEALPIILFLGKIFNQWSLAVTVTIAAAAHYVLDGLVYSSINRLSFIVYFFFYRLYYKFSFQKLCLNKKISI